jgi:GH24 family phage-related lysozyme (muramidase)
MMLKAHIQDIALDLTDLLRPKSLKQHQFDALVSFVYNIGIGAFKKSTMLSLIKADKMGEAASEFDKWTKAGGKPLKGLIRRRRAEKELFVGVPVMATVVTTTSPKKGK